VDDKAKEEWSGNNKMDMDELEGTPAVGKRKAIEVADEPAPKQTKAQGEKLSVVDEVVDDLPVEMRGAGRSPSSTGHGWWQMPSPATL
jgi:hypothetical protein